MRHNSADYIHTLTEAMKLGFADRDRFYGDPDFVRVPGAELLSKEYAALRRTLIDAKSASLDQRPGDPVNRRPLLNNSVQPAAIGQSRVSPSAPTYTCVNGSTSTQRLSATPSSPGCPLWWPVTPVLCSASACNRLCSKKGILISFNPASVPESRSRLHS